MTLDLTELKKTLRKKSGEEDSVWPSLTLTLYSEKPLAQLGQSAAVTLKRFIEAIPPGVLRSALIRDDIGPLTPQRIARDTKRLEKPAENESVVRVIYSSSEFGQPGDYGCVLHLLDLSDQGLVGPLETNVLRFELPWSFAEGAALEDAVGLFTHLADGVPFACGTAGLGFSYWQADRFAGDQVRAMLPRYLGFDHSDTDANNMRGRTPCASWLTFLSNDILERLGGLPSLREHVPGATVQELNCGLRIRAALRPPVGDVNRGAEDVGALPSLARWMKALRFRASSFHGSQVEMDVAAWLERFDLMQDRPWSNRA